MSSVYRAQAYEEMLLAWLIITHIKLHLVRHLPLKVHCELNHVVVGFPCKEDFPRVQLIESASH